MGRIARGDLLYNGCYAHVFSRSIAKQKIFRDTEDFEVFKQYLRVIKGEGSFCIYHYCIMNTHFHMAIEIKDVSMFSENLKALKRNYTYWHNKKYVRRGPLWRDRFKSMLIEDERYLSACGIYIEGNPVKAGLVHAKQDWPHSSSCYYESGSKDELIDAYDRRELPEDIDMNDQASFIRGAAIGSKMFSILLAQEVGAG